MSFWTFGDVIAQTEEEKGICFLDNIAWKQVVEEAIAQKKMIFVDCYTSWCGPCKILAKQVFPLPEVGTFFNTNFVNVKYDMEQPEGVVFNERYGGEVKNYPTMLVIEPVSGKILHKFVGRRSGEELIFEAKQGLNKQDEKSLDERYAAGERDFPFIKDYVLYLSLEKKEKRLIEVIDHYFKENESFDELLKDEEKWKFFSVYLNDFRSDFVQYVLGNIRRLEQLPFVNRADLSKKLSFLVLEGANALLQMSLENGQLVPFGQDVELRELLEKALKVSKSLAWRECGVAVVKLYDRLVVEDWRGAFELLSYMDMFEFDRVLYWNYWNVCAYIAERCGDRKLKNEIVEAVKQKQIAGEKRIAHFNRYDYVAFVQEQVGDKKGARESLMKYNEIQAAKKRISVKKMKSHKEKE